MQHEYERRSDSRGPRGYGGSVGGGSRGGQGGYGQSRPGGGGERRGLPLSELDPALTAISHRVIGCARDVHMALGPGYERDVYFNALAEELRANSIDFKPDHPLPVRHREREVGQARADLFIADRFIVRVLSQPAEVAPYQRTQLRAQLRAADVELGLIINFAGRLLKDGLVRVLNPDKLQLHRDEAHEGHEHGAHEHGGHPHEGHEHGGHPHGDEDSGVYDPDASR